MRAIKFRGKTKSGKWIYTDSILQNDLSDIGGTIETVQLWEEGEGWLYVEPATVGQFTGRKDSKGVEICENDIVKVCAHGSTAQIYTGVIVYLNDDMSFGIQINKTDVALIDFDLLPEIEVLGNVFDNKELLGWLS